MAGKVHTDYASHDSGLHPQLAPQRITRAYAEGYRAQVTGGDYSDNPHGTHGDIDSSYSGWWRGFRDASAGYPATHVGGPDGVLEPPPRSSSRSADDHSKKDKHK